MCVYVDWIWINASVRENAQKYQMYEATQMYFVLRLRMHNFFLSAIFFNFKCIVVVFMYADLAPVIIVVLYYMSCSVLLFF